MKNGLITGASRGIGREIAARLAGESYHLMLQGRNVDALAESCKIVEGNGGKASPVVADLSELRGVDTLVNNVSAVPLHLLVNNAGVAYVKPFENTTHEEWERTIAVNVTAPFVLVKKLFPVMVEGAAIVNIMSIAARTGFPNWSSYSMSKFALEGLMQSIREELRPRGIRVINIYPSATATELWKDIPGDWSKDKMLHPKEVAEAVYYAISRPSKVLVENITVGDITGTL